MDARSVQAFLDAGGFYFLVIVGLFVSLYFLIKVHKEERYMWRESFDKNTDFLRILSERLLLK